MEHPESALIDLYRHLARAQQEIEDAMDQVWIRMNEDERKELDRGEI